MTEVPENAVSDYTVESDTFPAELLAEDRWFVWAYDEGRKIPRAPWHNDNPDQWMSWQNRDMWTDFETADEWVQKITKYGHASCIPGREANSDPRLILFDFDNCRDPDTGEIHPEAWAFVQTHGLHAALSTSETGIHGYGWSHLPEGYKPSFERELKDWKHADQFDQPPKLECYAGNRFLALTGKHIQCTPVGVPDVSDTVPEMFEQFGSERIQGHEREPEHSREEVQSKQWTSDVQEIYDAIAHVRPRDITLRSPITEERADGTLSRDPTWASSESGTRLAELDDHWLYREGDHHLDALQVVALEERIITDESEYPSGDEFVEAVAALRNRGADIPKLVSPDDDLQPAATADGGTAAAAGGSGGPDQQDDDGQDKAPWERIHEMYRGAEDADDKLPARYEATEQLMVESNWRNIEENDQLWKYDPDTGIYRPNGEAEIRQRLTDKIGEQYKKQELREIASQIRGRTTVREQQMGGPDHYIATENCVIEIIDDGIERHDHSADFEFIGRVQTPFDPDAECPRWKAFLDESVRTKEDRKKLQEFAGYCLHHWGLPYHKALFLVGPTASGKSTFLDTIRTMLGNDAVSSLTPQQMTTERFGGSELYGSWANIRNDIPNDLIQNTGQFKEIVAGDPIKAEEKYKDPFMFKPTAKHMFSANELPEAETDDRAFYRRILLCAFPHEVPRAERDPKLDDKLQAEHPGILNWAIEGLLRLLENGRFTGDRRPHKTEDTWDKWGNSVKRFAKVCLEDDKGNSIPTSELFQTYLAYCEDESIPAESIQQNVTKAIVAEGYESGREYVDGNQQRVVMDVGYTGRGEEYAGDDDSEPSGTVDRF